MARRLILLMCLAMAPHAAVAAVLTATPVSPQCGDPSYLTDAQGTLFFAATLFSNHAALWTSDGSPRGTRVLRIANAQGDSLLNDARHPIIAVGGQVFFTASDGSTTGLWTSDGSESGTRAVSGACTMACGIGYHGALVFGNDRDGTLWTSTAAEGSAVQLSAAATRPSDFAIGPGGALCFLAGAPQRRVWASDGTAAGTRCLAEAMLVSGQGHALTVQGRPGAATLFVVAATAPAAPWSICVLAGQGGTLTAIPQPRWAPGAIPAVLGSTATGIIVTGDDGSHGAALWSSDGSHTATRIVDAAPGSAYDATRFSQPLAYRGGVAIASDKGLWLTDLTPAGTRLVAPGRIDVRRGLEAAYGLLLYSDGDRLRSSDGTPEGTVAVAGGEFDLLRSKPGEFCMAGEVVYFTGGLKVDNGHALCAIHGRGPQVAVAASASPLQEVGRCVELRVVGSDAASEADLRYTWMTDGAVIFTRPENGTAQSRRLRAEFQAAGSYTFSCAIANQWGVAATSAVTVAVPQCMIGLDLAAPPGARSDQQQFIAAGRDQFDHAMAPAGVVAWTVSGGGAISASGLFTAAVSAEASMIVTATCGAFTRKAQVIVRPTQLIVVCCPELTFNFQPVPYTITVSGSAGRIPLTLGDQALFSSGQTRLMQAVQSTASYIVIRPPGAGTYSFDIGDAVP